MAAAVGTAKLGEPAPPPLTLAFWCGDSHLPESGGVLDQDYVTYKQMMATKNIYDAVSQALRTKGADIHNLPASIGRTIALLKREGLM